MPTPSERRWTLAADLVLGATVLAWVALLVFADPSPTLRVVVPLIVVVVVVHRVLMLVEQSHRTTEQAAPAPSRATASADDAVNAA